MIPAGHVCTLPVAGRKRWWTCDECGQLWHRDDTGWKLTPRETHDA